VKGAAEPAAPLITGMAAMLNAQDEAEGRPPFSWLAEPEAERLIIRTLTLSTADFRLARSRRLRSAATVQSEPL